MHFERHFTVEEAEAMLDEIKDILSEIRRLRISLDMQLADLEKLIQTADLNGGGKAAGPYLDDVLRLSSAISPHTRWGRSFSVLAAWRRLDWLLAQH